MTEGNGQRTRRRRGSADDPQLNREMIVQAALEYIDAEGLANFSLRNLAGKLGVYPTAIYWYVPNRNEILAQVVTMVLDRARPQRKRRAWQDSVRDLFEDFRTAIRAHPNVAPLIGTQLVSNTDVSLAYVEHVLATLVRAGLSAGALVGGYNAVIAALVGFVAQEFAPMPVENPSAWQILVQERLLAISRSDYPVLADNLGLLSNRAFIIRWQNGVDAPLNDSFDVYIDLVIAGLKALAEKS